MYSYTHNNRTHTFEDIQSVRRAVYSHLEYEGARIHIEKDGGPYGMMVMLDDGAWIYTISDNEYRKVRPSGTVG
ncbi:MAG: hypothetical protein IIY21_04190 [Clostridiales bacterium]|nr:hypothetical protein [Clostridiales bacterium]MBQ1573915.1 hypothetical protein [Clostridiales bacterium]